MLKLCASCGKPIPYGQRYCRTCADRIHSGNARRRNKSRHVDHATKAFYQSKDWLLARGGYWREHGRWCIDCLNEYRLGLRPLNEIQPATEVHHIIPISMSFEGRLDQSNLIGLCHDHHDVRHGRRKPFFRQYDTYEMQMKAEPGGM